VLLNPSGSELAQDQVLFYPYEDPTHAAHRTSNHQQLPQTST
jgi:hypothetical protein